MREATDTVKKKITLISFLLLGINFYSIAQTVHYPVTNKLLYDFLDELANIGVIDLNTCVKPYTRKLIAEKLFEAKSQTDKLTSRQRKEIDFYWRDFHKDFAGQYEKDRLRKRKNLFSYADSAFKVTVNPILGIATITNDNDGFVHRWYGGEFYGSIGKVGIQSSLRDNYENLGLSQTYILNQRDGGIYKMNSRGGGDYNETRGEITYDWAKGDIGIRKDKFIWGNNYNGANIFSGRNPSFATIEVNFYSVSWLRYSYLHGWLQSGVIDSNRSYASNNGYRRVMRQKYLAANMLSIRLFKKVWISVGNSIIYADMPPHPAYFVPFFFFKSVDHTVSHGAGNQGGQNSQMFFDISVRKIRNTHIYISCFIDEVSFGNFWDANKHSNFFSGKGGFRVSNILHSDFNFTAEATVTNPIAYRHFVPALSFASNGHNLGHYMRENAMDIFTSVAYKPTAKLHAEIFFQQQTKGTEYPYTGDGTTGLGLPLMDTTTYTNQTFGLNVSYQLLNDLLIQPSITYSSVSGSYANFYQPSFLNGENVNFAFSVNYLF